jgi:transglutaminase-like putative cysteine protease
MSAGPTISVHAELDYSIVDSASLAFAVAVAQSSGQHILTETVVIEPTVAVSESPYGDDANLRLLRLTAPDDPLRLRYDATVAITPRSDDPDELNEVDFGHLPVTVLPYLNPSRYCQSDLLGDLAHRLFGSLEPGHSRVQAVNDWVQSTLTYQPGSTDASSGTTDVLVQRAGVCRDFAHVAISLCRALGIPARYVSGYGVGVEPQDFHGFFEAYLSGDWWLFDPTGMAPVDHLIRIGHGRDAADASFATFVGQARLETKVVTVKIVDGGTDEPPGMNEDVASTA